MKNTLVFLCKIILCISIFLGFVGIITSTDDRILDAVPEILKMMIIFSVFVSPYFITRFLWRKGEMLFKDVAIKNKEIQEVKRSEREVAKTNASYQDAKNRFKYLSDEYLKSKYEEYQTTGEEDVILLAIEEELVERGIINYSPMHEKLDLLKHKYKF